MTLSVWNADQHSKVQLWDVQQAKISSSNISNYRVQLNMGLTDIVRELNSVRYIGLQILGEKQKLNGR
jgi:hypothetical protein